MRFGKYKSRKTKKQALHTNQHQVQSTANKNKPGSPFSAASALAASISLLLRRHQGK